jgi:serine/threonine protein kinase
MLSGNLPFEFNEEANLIDLHDKIVIGKFDMPQEATLGSEDLIESKSCGLIYLEMLEVDPFKRLTIAEILSHPWSLSDFSLRNSSDTLFTYQHAKDSGVGEEEVLVPVDTTILPYLKQLYLQELEADIANTGLISDYVVQEEETVARVIFKFDVRKTPRERKGKWQAG